MSGAQRARETVAALYPDGVLPDGAGRPLARALGVSVYMLGRAALTVRADNAMKAAAYREPHETPWLSEYRRGFLDGVLAQQGWQVGTIEPPPGVCA